MCQEWGGEIEGTCVEVAVEAGKVCEGDDEGRVMQGVSGFVKTALELESGLDEAQRWL